MILNDTGCVGVCGVIAGGVAQFAVRAGRADGGLGLDRPSHLAIWVSNPSIPLIRTRQPNLMLCPMRCSNLSPSISHS